MKTLMFYSYKGGSGRTVASANVAAALAKLGQRVAIIDLDFEAPGLHHLFEVLQTPQYAAGKGIQHYLRGEMDVDELFHEVLIDLSTADTPFRLALPRECRLLYVMSSPRVATLDALDPEVKVRMRKLQSALAEHVDFLIIDSASGVRDAYIIATQVADEMFIFFRWSHQHVEGTLRIARYLYRLNTDDEALPFKLVASASPESKELEGMPVGPVLINARDDARRRVRRSLEEWKVSPPDIWLEIPEIVEFKWRERIIVFDDDKSAYQGFAKKLLAEGGGR